MKTTLLKISELTIDNEVYPRIKSGWLTAYQYAQAMKANSIFPPITVGIYKGKKYVVDGVHRIEAKKMLKEEYIDAIVKTYESEREMFVDAVKLNSAHGRQLSVQEKVRIIDKLKKMRFKLQEISELIKVPIDKIGLLQQRIIMGPKGEHIYLKSVIANTNAGDGTLQTVDQTSFNVASVTALLTQMIELLESGAYSIEQPQVKEMTVRVYHLLQEKLGL
ncbi:ParB/RepB/Spo0J family partition protein, partial [Candidatus Bathyarchaeota archaeon]|nr:ParB/RepB/Spo0J family partition protein [Candidatus Bathyarchaeota archaeon]